MFLNLYYTCESPKDTLKGRFWLKRSKVKPEEGACLTSLQMKQVQLYLLTLNATHLKTGASQVALVVKNPPASVG